MDDIVANASFYESLSGNGLLFVIEQVELSEPVAVTYLAVTAKSGPSAESSRGV